MTNNLVGKQLGKYQIEAALGRGGMGMVYKGYDPLLDRRVAIKVLAPHLVWEEGFVERFLREARAAARIKHPNIVTVYDVGQEQDQFYFVMEYLEGQTLADHIRERGALPPDEVLSILHPLADALDYAHQHDLVHRDIKPANIIIDSGHRVTLTDFGIARAAQETRLTSTGTIMGTPEYMSPEQAWGEEVGYQTDLYSLAVVAYEMLSGQVPFSGTTPHAVLYKQIHEPPPPIRDSRPELPEGVETVLARALDKEPGRRYGTASAFVTELELALAGKLATPPEEAPTQLLAVAEEAVAPPREPTPTPPPVPEQTPASQRATARRRVPRLLWVLGVLGALAILVGVVGIAWFSTGGRDEPTPTPSPQAAMQSTATLAPPRPPVAAEPECDDPAGCVTIGPDEPIQIGTIVYLSEPGGDLGAAAIRGIEMALEDKQRILEHPISLVAEHSGCEPDEGLRAAEALASNPGVLAVIGPTCSGAVQAAAERMCAGSIPLVSPSSAAPELTAPGRPPEFRCVLRTASHEATYAEAVAQFTMSRGVRRAATIQEANPLSESLVHVFSVHFQELGGEIVAREAVGPDSPDAAPIMERIAESEPQLVFLPLYVDWGAEITLLTRANPLLRDVALLGADGLFTRRYLAAAGEAAVGTFVSAPDIAVVGPAYVEFLARYEEVYGEPPRAPFHAPAYDAAMMIFAAIEDSALRLDDGTLIIRRQVLLERLFATRDFRGVTGNLSCTPSGDCGNSSVAVYEIVSPDPGHWHPGESPDNNPRRIWP